MADVKKQHIKTISADSILEEDGKIFVTFSRFQGARFLKEAKSPPDPMAPWATTETPTTAKGAFSTDGVGR
jgi:hypothetical protein